MFLEKLTEHTWGVKKGWPRSLMAKTSSKKMNLAVLNKSYLMIMNKLLYSILKKLDKIEYLIMAKNLNGCLNNRISN